MRKGLIIGLLVSLLIHGGLGWGPQLWARLFPVKHKQTAETQVAELTLWVPPPLPEVPPDPTEAQDDQKDIATLAPPSLMDVPSEVKPESFTEAFTPPPPPSLGKPDPNMKVVPTGNFAAGRVQNTLGQVFNLADLDQKPEFRGIPAKPVYPSEMRRTNTTGMVDLNFVVEADGTTSEISVASSTNREFETPAIQAVQKWRFSPGKKGGKNVRTKMHIPIQFNMNDDE